MSSRQLTFLRPLSMLAVALLLAPATAGAQARPRDMYVSVLDAKKAPVPDVSPNDLVIREDGVAREILRVVPATDPLQIALLVDDSQAATQSIQRMRDALTAFIKKVATGGNTISIVTLGDRPTLQVDATTDPNRLIKNGVERLFAKPGSGMYLLDAINDTAKGFKKREAARPVIIALMTEGVEFSNGHYQTTLDALTDAGASFYALVLTDFTPDNTRDAIRNRNVVLDRGTREHGGHRDSLLTDMAIQDSLTSIGDELLHQYKVTYARPDTLLPPKEVTVEAKAAGVTARGQLVRAIGERAGR
jgi:VWFA-related protein